MNFYGYANKRLMNFNNLPDVDFLYTWSWSKARAGADENNTKAFPEKPTKGGIPAKEKKDKDNIIANVGFTEDKAPNIDIVAWDCFFDDCKQLIKVPQITKLGKM